jgi:hypothetical protein
VFTARYGLNADILFRLIVTGRGRALARAVSRRPLTAANRALPRATVCDVRGRQWHCSRFPRLLLFSPVSLIPPELNTHLHLHFAVT